MMTLFDFESGVNCQIQHLEKILRPELPICYFHIPNP